MASREEMLRFVERLEKAANRLVAEGEQLGLNVVSLRMISSVDNMDGTGRSTRISYGTGNYHSQLAVTEEWVRAEREVEQGYHQAKGEQQFFDDTGQ